MKKGVIIPSVLFVAIFCVTLICQRYTLIFRENVGLFLLTPDWLREVFSHPWALTNFVAGFLSQFYAEPVFGPMIPAALITVIYLCLNACLRRCRVPFHRLIATALAITAWCLTSGLSTPSAMTAIMLISAALALVSLVIRKREKIAPHWWEIAAALVLIAGAAIFVSVRKNTKDNEAMAKVVINTGKHNWGEVLKVATPEKIAERPVMMPFALLAMNNQVKLTDGMFRYPIYGVESLDLASQSNAIGNIFQAYLFESLGVTNEAIHQMYQFSTNFAHGMTHLSLRNLIRYNIDGGHYMMATKYAEVLQHNLYYRGQAKKIVKKYGGKDDLKDSLEVCSAVAPAITQDAAYDILQIYKGGKNSPVVMDRLLALLLAERNMEDFTSMFYSFNWAGLPVPTHCQEALLMTGDIREGVKISPEISSKFNAFMKALSSMDFATAESLSKGTFWEFYYRKTEETATNK